MVHEKKLLRPFFYSILIGLSGLVLIFYNLGNQVITSNINDKVKEVENNLKDAISNQEILLKSLADTIAIDYELPSAIKLEDKNFLYKKYRSLFIQLKKSYGITHFSFHTKARKNIIRLHFATIEDDQIVRPSLLNASETLQITASIEQGRSGSLALRVVKPLFVGSEIIGFLELGTSFEHLLKKIEKKWNINYTFLVDRKLYNSKEWVNSRWSELENVVALGGAEPKLSSEVLAKIKTSSVNETNYLNGTFWKNTPWYNQNKEHIGSIITYGSIIEIEGALISAFFLSGLTVLIVSGVLFTIGCKMYQRLQRNYDLTRQPSSISSIEKMAIAIADEIVNPASIISISAAHLRSFLDNHKVDKNKIFELIDRIGEMSSRISKMNTGMKLVNRYPAQNSVSLTSVNSLISESLGCCIGLFSKDNIEIRLKDKKDVSIYCRTHQISQVLLNLLNNARDAVKTLPEKWIEIKTELKNDVLFIYITDSGKGISQKVADQMMTPFFTTRDQTQRNGLGLSISQEIINEHFGKLYYDSSFPNTRFVIELPTIRYSNTSEITSVNQAKISKKTKINI